MIGLKFDATFPFWISFIQSKVFPVTINLGKLFSWRHLSNWSAILLCKLLRLLIQYPCTPSSPELFQFGIFLICFLTFLISICMSSCTVSSPSSFSTFLNQSEFSLCVTTWSHISLQIVYSPLDLVSHFLFVLLPIRWPVSSGLTQIIDCVWTALSYCHIFLFLFQQQLTSVKLLREPRQHLFFLHWTCFQALIWRLHFALVSFYLIVLTLFVIRSTSLKFFFANLFVCLLSSPCFCNPPSQKQYCQQHVILSLFL